jgi:GntR family transcriptional regulator
VSAEEFGAIRADYPEPLWVQAMKLISAEIASGVLRQGMRLPPERELCDQLDISRVTLRKALARLVEDGVLSASRGRGWYVAAASAVSEDWPNSLESFSETASRMGLVASSRVLKAVTLPASLDEAEELGVAPGSPLFHLERVRLLSGVPIAIDRSIVPLELVPRLAEVDFTEQSLYDTLTLAGLELARADSTIEARQADSSVAANLGLEIGRPILAMRQLALDASDRPLFSSLIEYSGERYRLRTSFVRSASGRARPVIR